MTCKLCGNVGRSSTARVDAGLRAFEQRLFGDAYDILKPIAASGDPVAQCRLGSMLQLGMGVDADPDEAARYYRLAGAAGCPLAWNNLATICAIGTDTRPSDLDEANRCMQKALELGFDSAMGNPYQRDL